MSAFVHHVALAGALWALVAAGLRVAPGGGLARVVAAVVLAAGAAVAEALVLGLVGLGGSSAALALFALATWAAARLVVSGARHVGLPPLNPLFGAVAGLWGAWAAWLFLHPALGHDMVLYHLPEAIQWVHSGHTGAIDSIITRVPVGSYPLTHEVLLEWGLAIGRSFVWATLVTALAPALIVAAGWLGLRVLGVDRGVSALAVAALVSTPAVLASQSGGASLDPAALAWLVSCGALCACAVRGGEPRLLPPALVAAALAVGTKTTTGPLAVTVLAVSAWMLRGPRLRALLPALGAAGALAFVVGGFWYLRNIWQHGWPLWPFSSAPWGDPRPPVIANADVKFIDRPGATIDRVGDYYLHHVGAPLLMFCGALGAALVARSRVVGFACLATLVSILIWMNAPFTGVFGSSRAFDIGTGDATRYLLPGAAAAALTIALASRRGGWVRVACGLLLGVAAVIGVRQTFALGYPNVPSPGTPLAGMAVGAVALWLLSRVRIASVSLGRARVAGVGVAAVLAAGAAGAVAASGYVERHGETGTRESSLARWFATQPDWRDGSAPVASTWSLVGTLAGDRLQHPLVLVGALEACARGRAAGWLVVDRNEARLQRAPGCGVAPGYSDRDYQAYARLP
ncbi:MAG: hypothetical protein QOC77_3377 [Thermoleophilaceae bacterium]|nr:hypothetical protein [Thermoleophilaceae bacterium]